MLADGISEDLAFKSATKIAWNCRIPMQWDMTANAAFTTLVRLGLQPVVADDYSV